MAEQVEYQSSLTDGLKEGTSELREDVRRDKLEDKLQEQVEDKPLLKHLLDFKNILPALAIAAVLTLIVSLAASAKFGAFVLVFAFFAGWLAFAARDYNKRRPTKSLEEVEAEEDDE